MCFFASCQFSSPSVICMTPWWRKMMASFRSGLQISNLTLLSFNLEWRRVIRSFGGSVGRSDLAGLGFGSPIFSFRWGPNPSGVCVWDRVLVTLSFLWEQGAQSGSYRHFSLVLRMFCWICEFVSLGSLGYEGWLLHHRLGLLGMPF